MSMMQTWLPLGLVLCGVSATLACGTEAAVDDSDDDPNGVDKKGDGATDGDDSSSDDDSATSDGAIDGGSDASLACGADAGVACEVGHACTVNDDCEGLCTAKKCVAPALTDGRFSPSLGETDVDCGGSKAPACADEKGCKVTADCMSAACSTITSKCVAGPSCLGANGGSGVETCGASEAAGTNESCCRSLPLPTRKTRRLDRYEITAGRVRAFVDAVKAMNGGQTNVRAFAKAFAAAHPTSELGVLATSYPGLLDVLPDQDAPSAKVPLPWHLGLSPIDPINTLDGCDVAAGSYGHVTYWQDATVNAAFGLPARLFDRATLDKKPMNCTMPLMLAAFCAWDGGELARTQDYQEVWGSKSYSVGGTTVYLPWASALSIGQFNFRNGHGGACTPNFGGCMNPQFTSFYLFPTVDMGGTAIDLANDETPQISAPGRFAMDLTARTSANGAGWYDVAGDMLEAAWPVGAVAPGAGQVTDVCDVSSAPGAGETGCVRTPVGGAARAGTLRFSGQLPHIALVGYSFEGHARRSESYLAGNVAENKIAAGDLKPVTFQYGKVGGRCAR